MSASMEGGRGPMSHVVLSEGDIGECVRLIVDTFQMRSEDVEIWFERRIIRNPWQRRLPGLGVGIRERGRLIGCRVMFGQPWWLAGRPTVLAFAAHTAVGTRYHGQGLGTALIRDSCQCATITGSTSAGNITQKSYRALGFHAIGGADNDFYRVRASFRGSVERRLGTFLGGPVGRVLDVGLRWRDSRSPLRTRTGFRLDLLSHCDGEFDALWDRAKSGYSACLERTSSYLNWRLFDSATRTLRIASVRDSSGNLRAYGIWHVQSFGESIVAVSLRDLFCAAEDEEAIEGALAVLLDYWRSNGITWISLEVASAVHSACFRRLGYEHVPSIGNRYHIYSQIPLPNEVLEKWFRSGIDGDYFDLPASG